MRQILRCGVVILICAFAGASAQAQQWCAYSLVRDAQFKCGYSTEQACAKATKDPQTACTIDPFYD